MSRDPAPFVEAKLSQTGRRTRLTGWGVKAILAPLMDKKNLEKIKKTLMDRRRELVREVVETEKSGQGDDDIKDFGDLASEAYEKELLVGLGEHERKILTQIDQALERIKKGKYGLCQACGKKIPGGRLQAIPWILHCLSCSEAKEKGVATA